MPNFTPIGVTAPFRITQEQIRFAAAQGAAEALRLVAGTYFDGGRLSPAALQLMTGVPFRNPVDALGSRFIDPSQYAGERLTFAFINMLANQIAGRIVQNSQFEGQLFLPPLADRIAQPGGFAGPFGQQAISAEFMARLSPEARAILDQSLAGAGLTYTDPRQPLFSPEQQALISRLPPDQQAQITYLAQQQRLAQLGGYNGSGINPGGMYTPRAPQTPPPGRPVITQAMVDQAVQGLTPEQAGTVRALATQLSQMQASGAPLFLSAAQQQAISTLPAPLQEAIKNQVITMRTYQLQTTTMSTPIGVQTGPGLGGAPLPSTNGPYAPYQQTTQYPNTTSQQWAATSAQPPVGSGATYSGAGSTPISAGYIPTGNSNMDLVNTIANAPLFSAEESALMAKLPPEQQAMMQLQARKQREALMTSVLTNILNMKHESLKQISQNLRA